MPKTRISEISRFATRSLAAAMLVSVVPSVSFAKTKIETGDSSVLSPVVVTATRIPESAFDLPMAIDSVTLPLPTQTLTEGGLTKALAPIPGIYVQDRHTLAQDVQISSRGYGSRASFGVRGIRLLVDGIPATSPDGQGESSELPLSIAKRIEVMRGPFSTMYGTTPGGVVQVITKNPPSRPTVESSLVVGPHETVGGDIQAGASYGGAGAVIDLDNFTTDGYRAHSAGRRTHLYAKITDAVNSNTHISVLVNAIDQPFSQDPLGLTQAEFRANPSQAGSGAATFNTRKSMRHQQIGSVLTHQFSRADSVTLTDYVGTRHIIQYLPFTGSGSTSSGGVIDLSRLFGGAALRWTHHGTLFGRTLTTTIGASIDAGDDLRKGYVNEFGVEGALRRDEDEIGTTLGQYGQAEWRPLRRWSIIAGLRHTSVRLRTADHYLSNGNDSGTINYDGVTPATGILFHLTPAANLYATYAEGFETPTFDEVAYNSNGLTGAAFALAPGMNTRLKAATSQNYEIGAKAFLGLGTRVRLALFHIDTKNEIVVAGSSGGRTVYENAGHTRRNGAELAVNSDLGANFSGTLSATLLDARFAGGSNSGHHLPGAPETRVFAALGWKYPARGFSTGLDVTWNGKVYVDDANSQAASSFVIASWHGGFRQRIGNLKLREFAEVDNIFNKSYAAAVVVADSHGRYYEPARGRSLFVGMSAVYAF